MSSDDEPEWLIEQASARKEKLALSRLDDSSDFSVDDDSVEDVADSAGKPGSSAAAAKAGSKVEDGEAKGEVKSKGKGRAPPSARLPLLLAPKVRRDLLLLEADDPNLDLSGDFGCIGKLHVRKAGSGSGAGSSGQTGGDGDGSVAELRRTLMLDLKGKVYDADIVPCNSLCMMTVDANKAKIEAVFSDFVQLATPRDSIFDMQEVHGGQLGAGFFDDDEVLSQVSAARRQRLWTPRLHHSPCSDRARGGRLCRSIRMMTRRRWGPSRRGAAAVRRLLSQRRSQ